MSALQIAKGKPTTKEKTKKVKGKEQRVERITTWTIM